MKTIKFGVTAVAAVLAISHAASAGADDFLANDVRLGSYTVLYHTNADNLSGPYVPAGVNLSAENLETLYVGYVRWFTPNIDAELALGYPPLAKVKGTGPQALGSVPYDGQVISSARWISPTLLFEYNFFSPNSPFRPYIGAGVNYTTFYDRDSTAAGDAASGGPTKISLTASVSAAFVAGLTYRLTDRWHLHGSFGFSQIKSHLTTDTDGIIRTSNVSFAPTAIIVSIGYSFGH
ncbi:MAG TPA: OmpW family outer membrane protein [Steroidobacteraceae bacterium]|jgi:outer membrane protein|nr:OmpW family outer membrane protein [Steroidobacteraceae bacterium]